MRISHVMWMLVAHGILFPLTGSAQDEPRRTLHEGSAVVRTDSAEYKIRILCDDAARPELGFSTEANRVTRAATGGRYNMVSLRLRPWKDTEDVSVSLDGAGIAWIPRPTSVGGVLSLDVVLRPGTVMRNNMPVLVTYDMWKAGDIPPGETSVHFEANCRSRDPEAPSFRKLPTTP